jgi:AcrR family transcriptional regulator
MEKTLVEERAPGLRSRQKSQRRESILLTAKQMFEQQGIENTTMAAIAAEVGVSTPTVFNYFGTRDELLLAIILDGHVRAVESNRRVPRRSGKGLAVDLTDLLTRFTQYSMQIFSKPVWRYADSAAIRQPKSEFVKRYSEIDRVLKEEIQSVLVDQPIETRRGGAFDASALAAIIYNHWNANYIAFIKDDDMSIESHLEVLLPQVRELLSLVFQEI